MKKYILLTLSLLAGIILSSGCATTSFRSPVKRLDIETQPPLVFYKTTSEY